MDRAINWIKLQTGRAAAHPTREIIVFLVAIPLWIYGDGSPTGDYASLARSFAMILVSVSFLSLLSKDAGHHEMMNVLRRGDLDFAKLSASLRHEWTWRDDLGTRIGWFRRD